VPCWVLKTVECLSMQNLVRTLQLQSRHSLEHSWLRSHNQNTAIANHGQD
jgi:hypothetical protein